MNEPDSWEDFKQSVNRGGFAWKDLLGQDKWESWTVTRTSWTDVGTPTVTARLKFAGKQCYIQVKVVPSTSIATNAGVSYLNLPSPAKGDAGMAVMSNITSFIAIGTCVLDSVSSRLYVPTQGPTGDTITICGWYEV